MLKAHEPIQFDLVDDAQDFWPGTIDWHRQMGHLGSVCTVMRVGDESIGVLGMAFEGRRTISAAEVEFVRIFAQQAALAIQAERFASEAERGAVQRERAIAEQRRMQEMTRANESFQRVSRCLVDGAPLEVFLSAVLSESTAICGARSAAVFLFDETTRALHIQAFVCDGNGVDIARDPRMQPWRDAIPSAVVARWVLALHDKEYACHEISLASTGYPWGLGSNVHAELRHSHAVDLPLIAGGQLIGILAQYFCGDDVVMRFDYPAPRALAHLAALAAQQQQLADSARLAWTLRERERAERERVVDLARSNEALRVSIDALAEANADNAFLRRSLIQITAHAGADVGYLFRNDGVDGLLVLMGSVSEGVFKPQGQPGDPPIFHSGFQINPALAQRLFDEGRLIWLQVDPGTVDSAEWPGSTPWHLRQGHSASALHALFVGKRWVGLVGLMFRNAEALPDAKRELVHDLCQPLTLALELARLATLGQRSAEKAAVLTERNRLAREIHDGIAQCFLGIQMQLNTIVGKPFSTAVVSQALSLAQHGLTEARRAVAALRPRELLNQDWPSGVQQLLTHMTTGTNVVAILERPREWPSLPSEVEDHLFRIVQEAVNNVLKHAHAKTVWVELSQASGEATVLVEDDGVGFNAQGPFHRPGYGLEAMQQRARLIGARVDCFSQPGKGTQVLVSWTADANGITPERMDVQRSANP